MALARVPGYNDAAKTIANALFTPHNIPLVGSMSPVDAAMMMVPGGKGGRGEMPGWMKPGSQRDALVEALSNTHLSESPTEMYGPFHHRDEQLSIPMRGGTMPGNWLYGTGRNTGSPAVPNATRSDALYHVLSLLSRDAVVKPGSNLPGWVEFSPPERFNHRN